MPTQALSGRIRDPRDPFVSPFYSGLAGLPPLYIQAWSDESLLEDSRLFADRARQGGAGVRADLFPGTAAHLPDGRGPLEGRRRGDAAAGLDGPVRSRAGDHEINHSRKRTQCAN